MTLLAVPVFGESIEQVHKDAAAAAKLGADLVELRLDLIDDLDLDEIRSLRREIPPPVSIILTIRSAAEGGRWDGSDDERVSRLIELGPVADYVDVELATWQRSANIRQKVGLALGRAGHATDTSQREATPPAPRRALILSRHDLRSRPATLQADLLAMLETHECRVPKLAWRARTIRDNFEAFELMRESARPGIMICMGEAGLLSRVLAAKFGAFATFAALRPESQTATGQLSITELKTLYRWNTINADTRVYGLIGEPVGHSIGPHVHNAAFDATAMNAVYLPMPVNRSYESFKAFMSEVQARPWLDFRGFSVTIPHKENAFRYLREIKAEITLSAERIGALNTITVLSDGRLVGQNTDGAAVLEVLQTSDAEAGGTDADRSAASFESRLNLARLPAAVLGAGGVARAVVSSLVDAGAAVTVFNRTSDRGRDLANEFGCRHGAWEDRTRTSARLIVNCTSLGMWPEDDASPMPAEALARDMTVLDTVYRPTRTKLLRDAARQGCAIKTGLALFAHQAQAQFTIWTERDLPVRFFLDAAMNGLEAD